MTELFPVQVTAPDLPPAGDRPVVFHGVNKSGSLAMADVAFEAYQAAGRDDEFVSHYHDRPRDFDEFTHDMHRRDGHSFFVAHYIYKRVPLPPQTLLISQVRHPLPRALSVHGWLKRNHLRRHQTLAGFPELPAWVESTRGTRNTQMSQFALGFADGWRRTLSSMSPEAVYEQAVENLHRDFAWIGVAERFEESIFAMAHVCGLAAVPAWLKNTRNRWRQHLADTDQDTIDLIRDTFAAEFAFYAHVVRVFEERLSDMDLGPSISGYKARCLNEYGDRLLRA